MHITWHGQYSIKIMSGEAMVLLDPVGLDQGISSFKGKATHVGLSNPAEPTMSHVSGIQGDPKIIDTPGEYSFENMSVYAIGWKNSDEDELEKSIQIWRIEGINILHIGALARALEEKEMSMLEKFSIDIMLLPIGGGSGPDLKMAMDLVSKFEPRVIIPIHYALPKLKEKLDKVDGFVKEMGLSDATKLDKIALKASKLAVDETETYILNAK